MLFMKTMKTPRPQDRVSEVVDEIVEDLGQQDVLPASEGTAVMSSDEAVLTADELAGTWGDPVGTNGHQAPRTPLEDEANPAEILVQRGAEEAADELQELDDAEAPKEELEE